MKVLVRGVKLWQPASLALVAVSATAVVGVRQVDEVTEKYFLGCFLNFDKLVSGVSCDRRQLGQRCTTPARLPSMLYQLQDD